MIARLEITEIGNELGVILPPEILHILNFRDGDGITATLFGDSIVLTAVASDPPAAPTQ